MIAPPHKLYQRLALLEMLHLITFLILCLSVIVVGAMLLLNVNPLELFNGKAPATSEFQAYSNDDNEDEEDATHNYLVERSVHDRDASITSFRPQQTSTYRSAGIANPPIIYSSPGGFYRPETNAHGQSWESLPPPHSYPAHTTRSWPPVTLQPQYEPPTKPFRSPFGNNIQGQCEMEKIMKRAWEHVPPRTRPSIHHPSTIRSPENPIRSLPITKQPRTFTPRTPNELRWIYFKQQVSQSPYCPNLNIWAFAIPLSAIANVGRFMIAIVRFLIAAVLFVYCAAQRQPPPQGTTSVVVPQTPLTLKEALLEVLRKMISSFFEKIYCFIDDVFVTQDMVLAPACICHCALGTHPATSEFLRKAPRIQNALQPQTGLEEKIDALIDLQSRIEQKPQEVEHRSIRSCAKPLVKQVQTAIYEDKENGPQFAREHGQVLRFWNDMFLEIKPNQYLEPSTTTTQQTDSQPKAPSSLTSEPSSAVTTTSSNDSGTEGSEGQAVSSTRVEGRSEGGDALRYSASGSQDEHMYGGECLRPASDKSAGSPLSTLPCAFTFPGQFEVEVCDPADFGFESLMGATGDDDVEMGSESEDDELSARHREVDSPTDLQQRKRKRGEDDCEVTESDLNSDSESDASTGRPQKRRRVDTDRSSTDEDRTRPKKLVKKQLRFHRSPFIRVFNKHSAAKFYVDEYVGPAESWTATPPPRRPSRRSVPGRLPKDHPYLQHYLDTRRMFNDEMMLWQSEGSRRKQRERLRDCGTVRRIFKYLTTEHESREPGC